MNAVDFVQQITSELSGAPTTVVHQNDDQGVVIDVQATKSLASIIGKQGRTIDAVRIIANALGQDGSHRLRVRLNEPTDTPSN